MTRNGNGNFIPIELTEDLIKQEIVTNFIFDKRSKLLILSLNHKYKKKTVVPPVFKNDWLKTIQKFKDQMTSKGMTEDHMNMLCDIVDYNYEKILDIDEDENANANEVQNDDGQQKRKQKAFIRKYTCNGMIGLYESVIIAGQSSFLHLAEDFFSRPIAAQESSK
jgi:hypothetical protein